MIFFLYILFDFGVAKVKNISFIHSFLWSGLKLSYNFPKAKINRSEKKIKGIVLPNHFFVKL